MPAFFLRTLALLTLLAVGWLAACSSNHPTRQAINSSPETRPVAPHAERLSGLAMTDELARHNELIQTRNERDTSATEVKRMPAASVAAKLFQQVSPADFRYAVEPTNTETYGHFDDNPVKRVAEQPVSTFSIDVDTGAYANVRRMLQQGQWPAQDAVRVEEMINYFSYDYPRPQDTRQPFTVTTELAPASWNRHSVLLRVGLKGYDVAAEQLPPANLVFLVDVSGSMLSPDKLPLLQSALGLLVRQLRPQDRVSVVVYAGNTGVVLPPTPGDQQATIRAALANLTAGGSTNGGAGIRLAYAMAQQAYIKGGINRVLLATDGDFNVGTVSFEALKNLVEQQRKTGISLTTLGFGTGNYNDHLMEQLADAGNGNYAYIDTLKEANKVLVSEMCSTLQTIAKDVKIQIEFNPATVSEYRLIGYENRALRREDFTNDKVDAGDIGAGHTVTALYELTLTGSTGGRMEALRYQRDSRLRHANKDEIALLRLRYKLPETDHSQLLEQPIRVAEIKQADQMSTDFRFVSAVAGFGQLLRGGRYTEQFGYDQVLALAQSARGKDAFGYRGEFISLVNLARTLEAGNKAALR